MNVLLRSLVLVFTTGVLLVGAGRSADHALATDFTSAKAGPVSVEFTFADAAYVNTLSIVSPVSRTLFNTSTTLKGTRAELGNFSVGTSFRFQLVATTGSGTFTWSSDPTSQL